MARPGRPPGNYTQYHRLSRLREMLEAHPKGLSLFDVASRLKVTDRSVRRYLRELGREVDLERSPDPAGFGGVLVRIPSRDLPRRVKLHRTQIYGLLMARRVFSMLAGTTFEQVLRQAVDTLLSHVQRPPRRGAEVDPDTRLEDRFLYLPATPMKPPEGQAAEVLDAVLDACAQLRVCRVQYKKPHGAGAERMTIHPYAVVLYKDTIYCVAHVVERDGVRTLRVDRMVDAYADPLKHFVLPSGFSVDRHFEGHFGVYTSAERRRVVVDFHGRVAELVRGRRLPGEDGDAPCEELTDGWMRVTMHVGDTPELRAFILGYGEHARVVEPNELRAELGTTLAAALRHYEASASPGPKSPVRSAKASKDSAREKPVRGGTLKQKPKRRR